MDSESESELMLGGCVSYIYCVVFVMKLMIVPRILVCISFLISVCMSIVSKALLISSASDCSPMGIHLVEALCFSVV